MKKGLIFFVIFAGLITTLIYNMQSNDLLDIPTGPKYIDNIQKTNEIDLNNFIGLYNSGTFEKIDLVNNTKIQGFKLINEQSLGTSMVFRQPLMKKNYEVYTTNKPQDTTIGELGLTLTGNNTKINVVYNDDGVWSKLFLDTVLPLLLFVLVLVFVFKMFGPKGGSGFPFGAQAGKLRTKGDSKTTFEDVAGMEESKNELQEIVDYLKFPDKYKKAGARVPKGALLYGPPGSGKTLLARAVAGEAGVSFFTASGSEFMEMLVGMGAAKVRELFNKAKVAAPSIIFIDEIDTIGKKRGQGYTGGHQEQEQTLNQILTEMDGFERDTNVIVIAATNRPDILDPALMRAGRFDRKVYVGRPTLEERKMILRLHSKSKKLAEDADLDVLARRTSGFVGADLENIMNEAALKVAKESRKEITMNDLEYALEKTVMGPEKKIKSIKEKERQIITYHELGHAVTAFNLPNADPVEKISIVSRGLALGVTWMMPQEDRYLYSKAKFLDELVTLLGGRAAEEVFFGKDEITTGASNDFEKATKIATDMIMKYGMDEELGTICYYDKEKGDYMPFKPFSEDTAMIIDTKIKEMIKNAYNKSITLIQKNKETMEKLSIILLDKEYLTKEEFESIMNDPSKADDFIKAIQIKNSKKETENKSDTTQVIEPKSTKKTKSNTDSKKTNPQKNTLNKILDKFLPKK